MAQHDYIIENAPGQPVRLDINAALAAIVSQNSGAVEPTTMFPGMLWLDMGAGASYPNGRLRQRNSTNTAWVDPQTPATGAAYSEGTFVPRIDGTTVAGAGTYSPTPSGVWTRIGKLICFCANAIWSAHTGTGNMKLILVGLPNSVAAPNPSAVCNVAASNLTFTGQLGGYVNAGSNEVILTQMATGAALGNLPMDTAASVTVSGAYTTP